MRARLAVAVLTAVALLPLAATAQVRAGVGGDYVFDNDGIFEVTLAVEGRFARHAAVEGRFGGLIVTSNSPTLGVPLDFGLRLTPGGRVYLEALVGPWIFFRGEAVRFHGEFGFGVEQRRFSFGLAVGFLTDANAMLGARLAWRI
ncbi:MAG TPA: hypothetical protein VG496_10425 [Myxococcales bacterium]|nr:hypothetical protein [Myxococcales bacterium]